MPCFSIAVCLALFSGEVGTENDRALFVLEHARTLFLEAVGAEVQGAHPETQFKEAVRDLEQFARLHSKAPGYYLALGNATLLAGDLPRAILAYREGLQGAPPSKDLRSNLGYARSLVVYRNDSSVGRPPPKGLSAIAPLTFRRLFWGSLIVYTLALISLLHGWRQGRKRLFSISLAAALSAFLVMSTIGYSVWLQHQSSRHPLLVLSQDAVVLRRGNGASYPPRLDARLNKGVEARLLFRRGDWLQIELTGGQIGWIPTDAAVVSELDLAES
jgi:tetratricopeptide (TPR) repeat protein